MKALKSCKFSGAASQNGEVCLIKVLVYIA